MTILRKTKLAAFIRNLLFLTLLLQFNTSKANHWLGAEITYKRVSSYRYTVYVDAYRDCRSVSMTNSLDLSIGCGGVNNKRITANRTSITSVMPVCASASDPCSPANSRASYGVEKHHFTADLNLNISPFDSFKNCVNLIIGLGQCCRNGQITTGVTGNFYNYALLNPKEAENNNSPSFAYDPIQQICLNQPSRIHFGTLEEDGDSLSYQMAEPLRAYASGISYSSPYTYKVPLKVYDPSGTGYTNPNVTPPLGLHIDPNHGLMSFTPTLNNQYSPVVVRVREWRKDSKGHWRLIGEVRRDFEYFIVSCPGNNPPNILGTYEGTVCDKGSLTLTFIAEDRPKTIPPKNPPPKDSTKIEWRSTLKGFSHTRKSNILQDTVNLTFDHQTMSAAKRQKSYVYLRAWDDACPYLAHNDRVLTLEKSKGKAGQSSIKPLKCGQFVFDAQGDSSIPSPVRVWYAITKSDGQPNVGGSLASRIGAGVLAKYHFSDTFQFKDTGTYYIRTIWSAPLGYCRNEKLDTIVVKPFKPALSLTGNKSVCCDAANINLNTGTTPSGGTWYSNQNPSLIRFGQDFSVSGACDTGRTSSHTVHYMYTDPNTGCSAEDSINITVEPLPRLELIDITVCTSQETVNIDDFIVLPAKIPGVNVRAKCIDCGNYDPSKVIVDKSNPFRYLIYVDLTAMDLRTKTYDQIDIEVSYANANGCWGRDTMTLTVIQTPEIKFNAIPDMCWDMGPIDLKQVTNVTPSDGFWFCYDTMIIMPYYRHVRDSFLNGALATNLFKGDTLYTTRTHPDGGIYYMRYEHNRSGCRTFRDTFMRINPIPNNKIVRRDFDSHKDGSHTPPPYMLCEQGDSIKLELNDEQNLDTVIWSLTHPADTTNGYLHPDKGPFDTPFDIKIHLTNNRGCITTDSVSVNIQSAPKIERHGDALISTVGSKYQWYDQNGKISGANEQIYVTTDTGTFYCITDQICGSMESNRIQVKTLGDQRPVRLFAIWRVTPNPASGYVDVNFGYPAKGEIMLFSITGRKVKSWDVNATKVKLDLDGITAGVYILKFSNGDPGHDRITRLVVE